MGRLPAGQFLEHGVRVGIVEPKDVFPAAKPLPGPGQSQDGSLLVHNRQGTAAGLQGLGHAMSQAGSEKDGQDSFFDLVAPQPPPAPVRRVPPDATRVRSEGRGMSISLPASKTGSVEYAVLSLMWRNSPRPAWSRSEPLGMDALTLTGRGGHGNVLDVGRSGRRRRGKLRFVLHDMEERGQLHKIQGFLDLNAGLEQIHAPAHAPDLGVQGNEEPDA